MVCNLLGCAPSLSQCILFLPNININISLSLKPFVFYFQGFNQPLHKAWAQSLGIPAAFPPLQHTQCCGTCGCPSSTPAKVGWEGPGAQCQFQSKRFTVGDMAYTLNLRFSSFSRGALPLPQVLQAKPRPMFHRLLSWAKGKSVVQGSTTQQKQFIYSLAWAEPWNDQMQLGVHKKSMSFHIMCSSLLSWLGQLAHIYIYNIYIYIILTYFFVYSIDII